MAKRGVIIVAGGSGKRMQSAMPKQFLMLGTLPVVAHTINRFAEALPGAELVVVLPEEHVALWKNLAARFDVAVHRCVVGGKERFDSVKRGIEALSPEVEYIAVHDGVRALVSKKLIIRTMLDCEEHGATIPVVEVADSYRRVEGEESWIVPRSELRIVQTPQIFRASLLRKAYEQPFSPAFTDDASVVEKMGEFVHVVEGNRENIKITTPFDFVLAKAIVECLTQQPET